MTTWKNIERFGGVYLVSNDGQIGKRRGEEIHVMSQSPYQHGYMRVSIRWGGKRQTLSVHREMGLAFLPNPANLPVVRHLNDVPDDNRLDNLAWGTSKQNAGDRVRNGADHFTRRAAEMTHCESGRHERTPENLVERRKSDGRTTMTCKPCELERTREAYRANREKRLAYAKKRLENETPEQRKKRLAYQAEYRRTHR